MRWYRYGQGKGYLWCVAALSHQSDDCLLWPYARAINGVGMFGHLGKMRWAHSFVCDLVHGPRPSPKHIAAVTCGNGPKGCANPRHVKWMSRVEWVEHSRKRGLYKSGYRRNKLTPEQAREIRANPDRLSLAETAKKFGINWRNVSAIRNDWFWVNGVEGVRGWPAGDPRWLTRRTSTKLAVGAPTVRVVPEFAFLEAFIPAHLPADIRDDMRSDMIAAMLEGGSAVRDEIIRTRGAAFRRGFYTANYEQAGYGTSSLDLPRLDGRSWHDILPAPEGLTL